MDRYSMMWNGSWIVKHRFQKTFLEFLHSMIHQRSLSMMTLLKYVSWSSNFVNLDFRDSQHSLANLLHEFVAIIEAGFSLDEKNCSNKQQKKFSLEDHQKVMVNRVLLPKLISDVQRYNGKKELYSPSI